MSQRPVSVWNCLWGNALKRSPGIIRKSRVSYPGPGFLSSATWPSLPKKHYNGLNQTKLNNFKVHRAKTRRVIKTSKKTSWQNYVNRLNSSSKSKKVCDMIRKISGKVPSIIYLKTMSRQQMKKISQIFWQKYSLQIPHLITTMNSSRILRKKQKRPN